MQIGVQANGAHLNLPGCFLYLQYQTLLDGFNVPQRVGDEASCSSGTHFEGRISCPENFVNAYNCCVNLNTKETMPLMLATPFGGRQKMRGTQALQFHLPMLQDKPEISSGCSFQLRQQAQELKDCGQGRQQTKDLLHPEYS